MGDFFCGRFLRFGYRMLLFVRKYTKYFGSIKKM